MHAARSTQKESCRVVPNRSGCHHHASDPVFPRPGILLLPPPSSIQSYILRNSSCVGCEP